MNETYIELSVSWLGYELNINLLGILEQKHLFLYKIYACICLIYKHYCLNLLN